MNILQYESKIWATADLLRGSGIKESEWPSFMMPFFALVMIESRLIRMFDELKAEIGEEAFKEIQQEDLYDLIKDKGQGYNIFIFEKNQSLSDICKNDKSFDIDFDAYLHGFDGETKDLLGVDAVEGEKFLDIRGVIAKLKAKKVLLGYTKLWAEIDLKPFNNSEITTLEEHIKRKWADISAETAGEQYTPDDVIALISDIVASKIEESDKLLKIYDCTCGGGNMLFGVEDRINKKFKRLTQTYGQDWNDALYALAKIESRFRPDSKIEHGNTLVDDKFDNEEFDVVIANPPYGVSWSGFAKDIQNDKTERFRHLPPIDDGQLLFMQHLVSKMNMNGIGVVVHNGSSIYSGDAGSSESKIRKWLLDMGIVEAIIQLPTEEFFNTDIYTYLWVLNKQKSEKEKVLLIDASSHFSPLKKARGDKKKYIDRASARAIVSILTELKESDFSRLLHNDDLCYNKQSILITNVDEKNKSAKEHFKDDKACLPIIPELISSGETTLNIHNLTQYDEREYSSLKEYYDAFLKPYFSNLDYKKSGFYVEDTHGNRYSFDEDKNTILQERDGNLSELGCGVIVVKCSYKKPTKKLPERVVVSAEIIADQEKDAEVIPFSSCEKTNAEAIDGFLAKNIKRPFEKLENSIGVQFNFNKTFNRPIKTAPISQKLEILEALHDEIESLESKLELTHEKIRSAVLCGFDKEVKMKPSGIDWVGSIPSHWDVDRIVDHGTQNKNKNIGMREKNLLTLTYGRIKRKDINTTTGLLPESFETYQIVQEGTVILRLTDLQNDKKSLRVGLARERGIITSAYIGINFGKKIYPPYIYYLLYMYDLSKVFYWFGSGLRATMRYDEVKVIPILVPPLHEQKRIADYLDDKTVEIEDLVVKVSEKVDVLKELSRSMINEIVTGDLN
ncbi:N-6 DNA methylase [Vibrio diabolicus]|uniref:N-6 DNA methylase n=1 Tax=Vibrio diabolicus TaxID=50719 RepID=UPI0024946819|nr:N-6 DNA methylase [Vibrio diabolicus]